MNQQYIQFINTSGIFNILPQSARHKILCYCSSNNHYDCYKEVLDPIYPGQTITVSLINSRGSYGSEIDETNNIVIDTSSPTISSSSICHRYKVINSSETKQPIKHNNCTELKYSIAFPSDIWCELYLKTCFQNSFHTDIYGMDDYAKMWLQLAFPFYLIFIATLIIITSHYSTTIQRLTARRALPVLATLFLLSYTKILRIVCTVLFSYSTITHLPSKHTTLVWSVDANVPLFGVRFTILFIVCLIRTLLNTSTI